jgi:cysteine synthase
MIFETPLDLLAAPRFVHPDKATLPNLVALQFEFMKRTPARHCLECALEPSGQYRLGPEGLIDAPEAAPPLPTTTMAKRTDNERLIFLETSSGNMATGLAEVGAALGVKCHLLVPAYVEDVTKQVIRRLGATLEEIETDSQDARVARLEEIEASLRKSGWSVERVNQYGNPNNPLAYWRVAETIVSEMDKLDVLVAPVGTGGSSCGITRYLRQAGFPDIQLIGVDACGSSNFGHSPWPFLLGGLGSDRHMPLVDHTMFDVVHWIDDATAFASTNSLFTKNVKVGGSSGAAYVAAAYEALADPDRSVLVIFPDNAQRYLDSILSESWRDDHKIDLDKAKRAPVEVSDCEDADPNTDGVEPGWYRMRWDRRSLSPAE